MCVCASPSPFRKSSLCHAHLCNRVAMVAMRFDVGVPAAEPSCPTAPPSTSQRRRAQRARVHARVVLGVVRAVEALHGPFRAQTSATEIALKNANKMAKAMHDEFNMAAPVPLDGVDTSINVAKANVTETPLTELFFIGGSDEDAIDVVQAAEIDSNLKEEANITPDEESIATAMEPIAFHDSFDAAGDKNGEKVDMTPEQDSTAIDNARRV